MYGDIIFVERKPLLWRSTKERANVNSKKVDKIIFRTTKYRHYGVDLGNGRVIHFQSDSFWNRHQGYIMESDISEFLKDGILGVVEEVFYEYSREEVINRAKSLIGTNFGGYSLIHNNCEHFAMWCATDLRISRQSYWIKYGSQVAGLPKRLNPLSKNMRGKYSAAGIYVSKVLLRR